MERVFLWMTAVLMCAQNISLSFLSPILLLLLRNVGLMSVRVRYRLTNYHCHPPPPDSPFFI